MLVYLLLATIVIALLYYYWSRRECYRMASKIPGPPSLPIIGHAHHFLMGDLSDAFKYMMTQIDKYGPVTKLWMGPQLAVFIMEPDHVDKIVAHVKYGSRGSYCLNVVQTIFKEGLLAIDGEKWRVHRKIVSAAFQTNILEKFVHTFAHYSDIIVDKLAVMADEQFHDIYMPFTQLTLDAVVETAFGHKLNCLQNNDIELVEGVQSILEFFGVSFTRPWFQFSWFRKFLPLYQKHKKVVNMFTETVDKGVMGRLQFYEEMKKQGIEIQVENIKNPLLMDFLLHHKSFTTDEIVGEITSVAGAGAETTSTTCCFLLALLCENQHVQANIFEEQKAIYHDNFLRTVTSEDLSQMVYLEQVVRETLRLFPPLPIHYREIFEDTPLGNGMTLPKGTLTLTMAYMIHRRPDLFPDPEKFDPDRFSAENCIGRHPNSYTPFGLGRRLCVGHQYAIMEAKTIMSTVLRRYEFLHLQDGRRDLEESIQFGLILKPKRGFRIAFRKRKIC